MPQNRAWPLWIIISVCCLVHPAFAADRVPKEMRPRLDAKGAMLGSGFRITIIHPMRGNFAEYQVLEIVNTSSEVGDRIPKEEMERYTEGLYRSFQKAAIFSEVRRVDRLQFLVQPRQGAVAKGLCGPSRPAYSETECSGTLRPDRYSQSANAPNKLLATAFRSPTPSSADTPSIESGPFYTPPTAASFAATTHTMVITNEIIYYRPGSRVARAIGFGGGYHRFVVRFHIYDRELGEELAMGNVAGEVNSSFYSLPLLAGDAEGRRSVAAALVNRIEVRRAKSDQ